MDELKPTISNEVETEVGTPFTCNEGDGKYTICLQFRNIHTSVSSNSYKDMVGSFTDIGLFGLTRNDLFELANKILDVAGKLPVGK